MSISFLTKMTLDETIDRDLSIHCNFKAFHLEIKHLKIIHRENTYPHFIHLCIKSFCNASKIIV